MMHAGMLALALLAAPFWETQAPGDWTQEELGRLLHDSPWAQTVDGMTAFLASARPIQDAERELARRRKRRPGEIPDHEFTDFLQAEAGRHIVLAIPYPRPQALDDASDARKMEEESILKVGKKKYKMTGHFSPTPSDPYLRLVYPREVGPKDKSLVFELYMPGFGSPFRMLEFRFKDLVYRGGVEM